jgi:hypothetical protein
MDVWGMTHSEIFAKHTALQHAIQAKYAQSVPNFNESVSDSYLIGDTLDLSANRGLPLGRGVTGRATSADISSMNDAGPSAQPLLAASSKTAASCSVVNCSNNVSCLDSRSNGVFPIRQ